MTSPAAAADPNTPDMKIGVWESLLNELSEPLSESTKKLKEGVVPWSRKEALMKSGEFAALSVLNNRLDYCEEHVKMVDNMLALRHASTLEWMIIVLIVIEVFFDIFHFADHSPKQVIIVDKEQSS